jgi:histidinol dehydrogenase
MTFTARPARLSTTAADFEAQFAARLHWSAETVRLKNGWPASSAT